MQFSVQREQTFYFFPITSPTDVLHFFLFSLFSPVTVLASKLNLYRIITDILTQRYTVDPDSQMRNSIPHALLKLSSYRRRRLFFHDQYLQKRATEITSRTNKPTNSEKRRKRWTKTWNRLLFSLSLFLNYSTCLYFVQILQSLALKNCTNQDDEKGKTDENEGERRKKKMWCIVIRDTTRETGEKAFSWWRETFLSDREQSTRHRSRNNSRKRGKLRILVRKSLEKGRRGKKKKKKLKISLLFLS